LTATIKIGRLRWAGHVQRMGQEQMPKQLLNENQTEEGMWEDKEQGG
jgi:hypothetical protein